MINAFFPPANLSTFGTGSTVGNYQIGTLEVEGRNYLKKQSRDFSFFLSPIRPSLTGRRRRTLKKYFDD